MNESAIVGFITAVLFLIGLSVRISLSVGISLGEGSVRTEAVTKGFGYWDANKEFHWRGEK